MTAPIALGAEDIVVAGRTFRLSVATTFKQDMYIWQLQQDADIASILQAFDPATMELTEIAEAIIMKAYASGKLFDLLGAVTEEDNSKWSIADAKERAEFFAELTAAEDKDKLKKAMAAIILGFFVSGLLSSRTSKSSLTVAPSADDRTFDHNGIAEALTSETGTPSSGS